MRLRKRSIKKTAGDIIFEWCILAFLTIVLIVILYPLIYIVSCSVSDTVAVISGRVWLLPVEPTLLAYEGVFRNPNVITGYANSLFYAFFGTIINLTQDITYETQPFPPFIQAIIEADGLVGWVKQELDSCR